MERICYSCETIKALPYKDLCAFCTPHGAARLGGPRNNPRFENWAALDDPDNVLCTYCGEVQENPSVLQATACPTCFEVLGLSRLIKRETIR